jgi:Tetratricopeptide repeat
MNQADRGRHLEAVQLLTESAAAARQAGTSRQEAWSQGVLARSLLLAGQLPPAQQAAEHSMAVVRRERWNAFLPWPQVLHAECLVQAGRWDEASEEAEHAFALASDGIANPDLQARVQVLPGVEPDRRSRGKRAGRK